MKSVKELIEEFGGKFKGGKLDDRQSQKLRSKFADIDYFDSWLALMQGIDLINLNFELNAETDISDFGADFEIMNPQDQMEEAYDFYPGIAAIKSGYIPFGICLSGSGDPYFINYKSDEFIVYRIPHDAVLENDKLDENKIEKVISIESLLNLYLNR